MAKLKRVRNVTGVSQSIVVKGQIVSLGKQEEKQMDSDLADAFIERCAGVVVEVIDDFGAVADAPKKDKTVWVANVTGDPDAPDTVTTRIWKNKHWEETDIKNPVKRPWLLKEEANGGMQEYTDKSGTLMALNLPTFWISLPAYRRIELEEGLANWFLGRQANGLPRTDPHIRKAIVSRAPGNFEPDISWDLDELNMYLLLLDIDAVRGPSEKAFKAQAYRGGRGRKAPTDGEYQTMLDDQKRLVMKRIYFRLVDPRFRLPDRKEFAEAMKGASLAEVDADLSKVGANESNSLDTSSTSN